MYPHCGFDCEIARDHRSSLLRHMGLDHPAADAMAAMEASRRAEAVASRHRPSRPRVASRHGFAWGARPGLSHL